MENQGAMVVVVGPSGVGKDSLMQYAADCLSGIERIRFVKRSITRSADSGGEAHDCLTAGEFDTVERQDGFAVSWQAHGLKYGIPRSAKDFADSGGIAVANGSRHALQQFSAVFPNLLIVSVTAEPTVIASRLRARGRESEEEIIRRLERPEPSYGDYGRVVSIDNSADLARSGNVFVELLKNISGVPGPANFTGGDKREAGSFDRFLSESLPFL